MSDQNLHRSVHAPTRSASKPARRFPTRFRLRLRWRSARRRRARDCGRRFACPLRPHARPLGASLSPAREGRARSTMSWLGLLLDQPTLRMAAEAATASARAWKKFDADGAVMQVSAIRITGSIALRAANCSQWQRRTAAAPLAAARWRRTGHTAARPAQPGRSHDGRPGALRPRDAAVARQRRRRRPHRVWLTLRERAATGQCAMPPAQPLALSAAVACRRSLASRRTTAAARLRARHHSLPLSVHAVTARNRCPCAAHRHSPKWPCLIGGARRPGRRLRWLADPSPARAPADEVARTVDGRSAATHRPCDVHQLTRRFTAMETRRDVLHAVVRRPAGS